ncbi:prolipoprotein diacylglyceryl transferase [candidate division KSB1 bacterium]|nr:prolipoprotein diacylglyceryl transferase [candidate division KSB1 bacterium]
MSWWQQLPGKMSPTIFSYGALQVRWYGLMYVVAFAVVYFLVMYRYRVEGIVINKKATQNWFSIAILAPFSDL